MAEVKDNDPIVEAYKQLVEKFNTELRELEREHPTITANFTWNYSEARSADEPSRGYRSLKLNDVTKTLFHKEVELPAGMLAWNSK